MTGVLKGFELHCLYWPNASERLVSLHKQCFEHIGIPVYYTNEEVAHGQWMDRVLTNRLSQLDVLGFVDVDCLAYSFAAVSEAYDYVMRAGSFIGLAQSANHLDTSMEIYAAPSFLLISRRAYDLLGRPSLEPTFEVDVAQNLSRTANKLTFAYRALYPIGYHMIPNNGLWRLGNFGFYGLGTQYEGGFFHNFNSRLKEGVDLLEDVAKAILSDQSQPAVAPFMSKQLVLDVTAVSEPTPDNLIRKLTRARGRFARVVPKPLRRLKRKVFGQHL